jgi:hypothetical protein
MTLPAPRSAIDDEINDRELVVSAFTRLYDLLRPIGRSNLVHAALMIMTKAGGEITIRPESVVVKRTVAEVDVATEGYSAARRIR